MLNKDVQDLCRHRDWPSLEVLQAFGCTAFNCYISTTAGKCFSRPLLGEELRARRLFK